MLAQLEFIFEPFDVNLIPSFARHTGYRSDGRMRASESRFSPIVHLRLGRDLCIRQHISKVPGSESRLFHSCFQLSPFVAPAIRYLAEQRAHAVVLIPAGAGVWLPRLCMAQKRTVYRVATGSDNIFMS